MRQVHRAGEKLFVDFSGKRPSLVDATTGAVVVVELFVGVLGASGLIYAEATRRQDLAAWVSAHVRMVEYFGGSPAIWVPDNLKSGVTTANYYEPEIDRTYTDLARHDGAIVLRRCCMKTLCGWGGLARPSRLRRGVRSSSAVRSSIG